MNAYAYPMYNQGYQALPPTYHQPAQPTGLHGKTVSAGEVVTPQQVPMDGSVSYFPTSDGSCIYAKQWTAEGYIATRKYVPDTSPQPAVADDPVSVINGKVDKILEMLGRSADEHPADGLADVGKQPASTIQP